MDDEKAKKILDFLLKKYYYKNERLKHRSICFVFRDNKLALKHLNPVANMFNITFPVIAVDTLHMATQYIAIGSNSYAKALEKMLEYSSYGFYIAERHMARNNIAIMPPYTTLEQIEIMMDLEANDK